MILDASSWNRSRNQQRNWETLNQLIALRTLPEDITVPQREQNVWVFDFAVPGSLSSMETDLQYLTMDCEGVPMITGLDEAPGIEGTLIARGDMANIWFDLILNK
jgi:hypothetical protein